MSQSYADAFTGTPFDACNPATQALLAKFTPDVLNAFLAMGLKVVPNPEEHRDTAAVFVERMPLARDLKAAGGAESLRWSEYSYDPETNAAFKRRRFDFFVEKERAGGNEPSLEDIEAFLGDDKYCPETPHSTVMFRPNLDRWDAVVRSWADAPKGPFEITEVHALGRPGGENAWGAVMTDPALVAFLEGLRTAESFCGHPDYVPTDGGYEKDPKPFGVKPHGTLVRNLAPGDVDPARPLALGCLEGHRATFVAMTVWNGMTFPVRPELYAEEAAAFAAARAGGDADAVKAAEKALAGARVAKLKFAAYFQ